MTIPDAAKLEAVVRVRGREVAIMDVNHLLPTNPRKPIKLRSMDIERLYVHKSGGEGAPGFAGLLNSTRFVIQHRDFPGCPYPWWSSTIPDTDPGGRLVAYRGVADNVRAWHTGGVCNDHGSALALQGNLSKRPPTAEQAIVAEAVLLHALAIYPKLDEREPFGRHSDAKRFGAPKNKPVCPGSNAETWLDNWIALARTAGLI